MKIKALILTVFCICALASCDKEEPPDDHSNDPLEFRSLIAGRDVIMIEDTTRISADAEGYELSYYWSVDKGDILGSGKEITYVATPCTIGDNQIFCTVKSSNGKEETKYVTVTVL